MRPIKPNTRRRPLWRTVLLALVAIVIGGAGTVALLGVTKVIDLAKLAFWRARKNRFPRAGLAFPCPLEPIPAYTMVTRDYLINPKTGAWELEWSAPEHGSQEGHYSHLSKDSRPGDGTREAGCLLFHGKRLSARGTHPGVAGGTPQGKRAITLDAGKLKGVCMN